MHKHTRTHAHTHTHARTHARLRLCSHRPSLLRRADAGSAEGPSQRLQYLKDHHGFTCVCERCACNDVAEEAELAERLDAIRCCCDDCGAGLSYPLLAPSGGQTAELEEDLRQCVLCGGQFEPEYYY